MDMLVVLLTEDASHSHWVDQEIGYAMGSNTPVVTIRLGADPFGFVAKFQAISGQGKSNYDIARELFSLMLVKNRLRLRDQAKDALILAFRHALSFDDAANLGTFLPSIDALTPEQMDNLVHAYNNNYQCYQCFRLQESIVPNLNRLSSNGITYEF